MIFGVKKRIRISARLFPLLCIQSDKTKLVFRREAVFEKCTLPTYDLFAAFTGAGKNNTNIIDSKVC